MNQRLKTILDLIVQSAFLSDDEKTSLAKTLREADKELEITAFKLDRTEKVKRTTAILLEETIEELELKRKAVEEKNRDLEIEASLERVRTMAMGMNKPDDMLNVCRIISDQLQELGFSEIRNVQTVIIYEQKYEYLNYQYFTPYDKNSIERIDYRLHPDVSDFTEKMLQSQDAYYTKIFEGDELNTWRQYRKQTSQLPDPKLDETSSSHYYFYSIGPGALGVTTYAALTEDQIILFKRFRNVFQLAYSRFIDIELALAQANEAKIETSLERARAQAMSMRKPDDLLGICEVLFTELHALGFSELRNAMINIHDDEKASFLNYDYSDKAGKTITHHLYDSHPVIEKQVKQIRSSGDAFSETVFAGKDLEDWKEFRKRKGEPDDPEVNNVTALFYYFYSIGTGAIGISTYSSIAEEKRTVLKRFRNVFDLAYRRFIDIQQAEAQAREAQIELALERVRARTMAMQQSEELKEAATLLFQQIQALGISVWTCGYNIWEIGEKFCIGWMSTLGAIQPSFRIPLTENAGFIRMNESRLMGESFFIEELGGEALADHYRYMFSLPDFNKIATARLEDGFTLPGSQVQNVFNFNHGNLIFISAKPVAESHDIFRRFTAVFEQTYTRFLDLQKAEAQAREAQIEMSLERVRSAANAMHKSTDLLNVISILSEQFLHLGFKIDSANFNTNYRKKDWNLWLYNPGLPMYPGQIIIPYFDHPYFNCTLDALTKGSEFNAFVFDKKDKDSFLDYVYKHTVAKNVPDERKKLNYSKPGFAWSVVYLKNTAVTIANYDAEPYTEEQNAILRRFGNVFEQSYTRFLDLQKAEAQSREAQIELALERVRARTMAMQKSDELSETAFILFQQFKELGEIPIQITIGIINEPNATIEFRITGSDGTGAQVNSAFNASLDEPTLIRKIYKGWKANKKSMVIELAGKDLMGWVAYRNSISEHVVGKDDHDYSNESRVASVGFFSKGLITISTHIALPAETLQLLERFAAVFDLTYTRFNDLKLAEAQARESQIQLGLERVRARTMAMQRSDELAEASFLLFKQINELGIKAWSAGFNIWSADNRFITVWMTNPYGSFLPPYKIPLNEFWLLKDVNDAKQRGEELIGIGLMNKEQNKEVFAYLSNQPELKAILESMEFTQDQIPETQVNTYAFFSQGCLVFFSQEPLTESHTIFKRFAKVFEQTYTRFLDLKTAEAQAREAQIEAALERVRSRSMGMQKSEELKEVIQVVYDQFVHLNIHVEHTGFIMDYKERDDMHIWLADKHEVPSQVTIPYFDCAHWNSFKEAKEKGIDFFATQLSFEEKNKFYQDLFKIIPGVPEETLEYYFNCPGLAGSTALLENIGLYIENFDGTPYTDEENNTLMRFGKVFQQTYTRFLDLKNAEEQARESQVETALEKVRSRTMAMQRSQELPEAANNLFLQVQALGIPAWSAGYCIWDEDKQGITLWMSSEGVMQPFAHAPLTEDPSFIHMKEAYERGDTFHVEEIGGQELEIHYKYMRTLPVVGEILDSIIAAGHPLPAFQIFHCAYFSEGFLLFITYEPVPEAHNIFNRFRNVFEQTYTRFLDLQKAEAQAREAQIQLALERARTQSMIMQHSTELDDTLRVFHEQVLQLGIPSAFSFLWLPDEEKDKHIFWAAWAENNATVFKSKAINYPLDRNEPATAQCLIDWKSNEPVVAYHVPPASVKDYFAAWSELIAGAEELKPGNFSDGLYYVEAFMKYGCFGVMVKNTLPEHEKKILSRFAVEFERAYTRFLDLQKSEAQSREAQIELGLERVRARAMAMQKSGELSELVDTVFKELTKLDFALTWCIINIIDESSMSNTVWAANPDMDKAPESYYMKFEDYPFHHAMMKGWKERKTKYVYTLDGLEKKIYDDYLFSETEFKRTPGAAQAASRAMEKYVVCFSFSNFGGLQTVGDAPLSDASLDILSRFGKVFDLTYTRFNDLKQAEAQAREARIEAALEKVRSRTMGMQQSHELGDVATALFRELNQLVENLWSCGFVLCEKDRVEDEWWLSTGDGFIPAFYLPNTGDRTHANIYNAWEKGETYHTEQLEGENLQEHYDWLMSIPVSKKIFNDMIAAGLSLPAWQKLHCAYFSYGYLVMITLVPCSEEQIFKRFALVFDQTYTRFLDLQKAEAQSRESQVQLALERVRARTMAMQHSDELKQAAALLFQQVKALGVPAYSCGYNIWEKNEKEFTSWMSTQDGSEINGIPNIALTEDANFIRYVESKQKGEPFFVLELRGERMEEHYQYLKTIPAFKGYFDYAVSVGYELPDTQIHHLANFSQGNLLFITLEPCPEFHDVFKRFAAVFEQTYTRFLDLQKAEAQAKESQIQLALERVRARTMAMQKSDELREVVVTLYEQLRHLHFDSKACNIIIIDKESNNQQYWVSGFTQEIYPESYNVPYFKHPYLDAQLELWKKGEKYVVIEYSGKTKQRFDEIFFTQTDFKNIPENAQKFMRAIELVKLSTAYFSYGALQMLGATPLTEENVNILQRFAKVFEQTYTRFLDLQKAEAQAREAQIQLAMERVRARTMAMQRSDELAETASLLFKQISNLGIQTWTSGFNIWEKNDSSFIGYNPTPSGDITAPYHIPSTEDSYFKKIYTAKKTGEDFLEFESSGESLANTYGYMKTLPVLKDVLNEIEQLGFALPTYQVNHCVFFAQGFLLFITTEVFPNAHDIFKRFGKVFEQTYTRFLDLQKAEAQAREATIEAALERVRARTMAMQKSAELTDVAGLLFAQVSALGIKTWTAGFNVWSEDNNSYVDYITSPNGGFIEPYTVFTDRAEALKDISDARKSGVEFDVLYVGGEKIKKLYAALTGLGEEQFEKMLQDGVSFPSHQYEHFVFGSKVSLMFITYEPVPEAHDLFKRLGKVFEQTYTRFLDLQKAEAQAKEANIEAALERVRARTMAMQKSAELQDASLLLFQQVQSLGIIPFSCGFNIWDDDKKEATAWMGSVQGLQPPFKTSSSEDIFLLIYEAAQRGESLFVKEQAGKEVEIHYEYLATIPVFRDIIMPNLAKSLPKFQIMHCAFFSQGYLMFISFEPVPGAYDIFKRFANVFEQTYTRFLDLQKAEAQAREAQIEAALEAVRATSMAMHHSEELQQVVTSLFDRLVKLGVSFDGAAIYLFEKAIRNIHMWVASKVAPAIKVDLPYDDDIASNAITKDLWNVIENDKDIVNKSYSGNIKDDYFRYVAKYNKFKIPEPIVDMMLEAESWTASFAAEKTCIICIDSWEGRLTTNEDFQILKRFAKVFEQCYVRFLDLQKAEAQAREAQIETALEKVRSRSLAMHKSDELEEVVHTVFEKLKELDVDLYTAIIFIFTEGSKDVVWWLENKASQKYSRILVPYADNPFLKNLFEARENEKDFFSASYSFEEKNDLFHHLFENTDFKHVPDEQKEFLLKSELATMSVGLSKNMGINITSYSKKSFSDMENEIVKRFTKVFDQAYVRFLDLQKAEAQAKEARIEAALERVRSRTMAMQKSDELTDVAGLLFKQITDLGIKTWTAGFNVWSDDNNSYTDYITSPNGGFIEPYIIHPEVAEVLTEVRDARKSGMPFFVQYAEGERLKETYLALSRFGDEKQYEIMLRDGFQFPSHQYDHFVFGSKVSLMFITYEPVPEVHDIFKRFAKVFEQTYTRFLDLQKAEAQATEAIKRASVDRVRAEIASMRTTGDLERITPLIWNELTTLGVPFIRCGVFIMDEEQQQVQSFLSTPDGKAIAAFRQPYSTPGEIAQMIISWQKKEMYKQHWDEAQFIDFTKNLAQQGAITSGEKYFTENLPTDLYLHFLPFLQGMLYAGNTAPLSDDELQLVQNLADAFSTAYARYEDFNKLELAKEQIENTLVDLKQAQSQLVQSEKMASLGELTAGIAHEIQNPLNFVNNFSEVSNELIDEMKTELETGNLQLATEIADDIKQNLEKINHHGRRADAIVKGMLQHSRSSSSIKDPTDINKLVDEYLRLAYHGLRAKDKSFNATLKTDFDQSIGHVSITPQDMGRVILNLINNAFYAVTEKKKLNLQGYEPGVTVSTKKLDDTVEVKVQDNGNGIPEKNIEKIFNPFFTTKPTGQGTGLGLSLAYDIVKAHGGELKVETTEGEGSEFVIQLPNHSS
jgi:signal transduction histidine kinase